jgi:hypothetical protein
MACSYLTRQDAKANGSGASSGSPKNACLLGQPCDRAVDFHNTSVGASVGSVWGRFAHQDAMLGTFVKTTIAPNK